MSFFRRFKQLDVYRDIPKEYTEATTTGAAVSLACTVFIVFLFFAEFVDFMAVTTTSSMYVAPHDFMGDDLHADIHINLNITLPELPCAVTSVDAQDVMGSHVVDVGGELHKLRLDKEGRVKRGPGGQPLPVDLNKPRDEIGEGCNVNGYLVVKRVPGNFHISAHSHADLLHIFFKGKPMNLTHKIHHLSFGEREDAMQLATVDGAETDPLRDTAKRAEYHDNNDVKSYEYYIKIVPSRFAQLNGEVHDAFQFVANSNEVTGRYRLPAMYFRYDFSPITVEFREEKEGFAHFLVQVCAIIGGVFTVMGLVNGIANSTVKMMMKKAQINKLG